MGCSVNGTGVNGSGTLTCAAMAVSTVMNSTAAIRSATSNAREGVRMAMASSSVTASDAEDAADTGVCSMIEAPKSAFSYRFSVISK